MAFRMLDTAWSRLQKLRNVCLSPASFVIPLWRHLAFRVRSLWENPNPWCDVRICDFRSCFYPFISESKSIWDRNKRVVVYLFGTPIEKGNGSMSFRVGSPAGSWGLWEWAQWGSV
jgi:hypothetical protein